MFKIVMQEKKDSEGNVEMVPIKKFYGPPYTYIDKETGEEKEAFPELGFRVFLEDQFSAKWSILFTFIAGTFSVHYPEIVVVERLPRNHFRPLEKRTQVKDTGLNAHLLKNLMDERKMPTTEVLDLFADAIKEYEEELVKRKENKAKRERKAMLKRKAEAFNTRIAA